MVSAKARHQPSRPQCVDLRCGQRNCLRCTDRQQCHHIGRRSRHQCNHLRCGQCSDLGCQKRQDLLGAQGCDIRCADCHDLASAQRDELLVAQGYCFGPGQRTNAGCGDCRHLRATQCRQVGSLKASHLVCCQCGYLIGAQNAELIGTQCVQALGRNTHHLRRSQAGHLCAGERRDLGRRLRQASRQSRCGGPARSCRDGDASRAG